MAHRINNADAEELLAQTYNGAQEDFRDSAAVQLSEKQVAIIDVLFKSSTQAYREALVGCAIARALNPAIDIRLPTTDHGDDAFSGRSLADHVVTPFMRGKSIPISAGPYLSSLRGGARFIEGGEPRIQRDKEGFAALVSAVGYLRELSSKDAVSYLRYLMRRFIEMRESTDIKLKRIAKPSLEQLTRLIDGLLELKSGGRFASFLTIAMFQTLTDCFDLGWAVEFQGINVADKASGAVGDITVRKGEELILGVEVTERPISQARVKITFDQKISPNALSDYLFVTTSRPEDGARATARSFTAVGHEMNFVDLRHWLYNSLATVGPACRTRFQDKMIELCSGPDVTADLKLAWNDLLSAAIGVSTS